jgi:LacI family transcriptional regulator
MSRNGSSGKPTLYSVANHAGVSIASVSRVINGLQATEITEAKVRKAIADLGYQPNSAARALKVNASNQVLLILPDLSNPVYQAMIGGIQQGFKHSNYRVMLSPSLLSSYEVIKQLKSLGQNYADGLIINPIVADDEITELLKSLNLPVVFIGEIPKELKVDSIKIDAEKGVQIAVDHFYEKDRKKILFLNGPAGTNPAKVRKHGFVKALSSYGITNVENQILNASAFTAQSAIESLSNFKNLKKYNAILCGNDLIAAGAIKYLTENGLKIPRDLAVIGIDNTDLGSLISPTLTSLDFKAEYRGQLAAQFLKERLESPNLPIRSISIEPELIIRESA